MTVARQREDEKREKLCALVREYGDDLVRFCFCYLRDAGAAEDAAADVFATLVCRHGWEKIENMKSYLFRMARNRSIDYLRRRSRRDLPLDDLENVLSADPHEDAERNLQAQELYRCLQRLPGDLKEVLFLIYYRSFSVAEACTVLKKSRKQVYNLLARAKRALKEILISEGMNLENV